MNHHEMLKQCGGAELVVGDDQSWRFHTAKDVVKNAFLVARFGVTVEEAARGIRIVTEAARRQSRLEDDLYIPSNIQENG